MIAVARVTLFGHDPLGVDGPPLDERARPERGPHGGARTREPTGMLQLQVVAGHRLVHHQVVHHVPVVLAVERGDALSRPVGRAGETAMNVGSGADSSGPGESQYATATPRSISGIAITSTGSSKTETRRRSVTKAVWAARASRQKSRMVASSGTSSASRSSTPGRRRGRKRPGLRGRPPVRRSAR